jgi:hypothetical protein
MLRPKWSTLPLQGRVRTFFAIADVATTNFHANQAEDHPSRNAS